MIMKTLEWWVILLICFDMCSWTPDDLDDENVEAWALALYKTDGCLDAIPFQFYRKTTIPEIWVGLDWKFIYLSMGFLTEEVWAEATSWWMSTCAVPKMTDGHGWEVKLIGEVPILGCVIERLGLIIRILSMVIQDCSWQMYRMLWWKCTISAECQTIRIALSKVMDSWSVHTVPPSDVFKMTCEMNWDFDLTTTGLWSELQVPT